MDGYGSLMNNRPAFDPFTPPTLMPEKPAPLPPVDESYKQGYRAPAQQNMMQRTMGGINTAADSIRRLREMNKAFDYGPTVKQSEAPRRQYVDPQPPNYLR